MRLITLFALACLVGCAHAPKTEPAPPAPDARAVTITHDGAPAQWRQLVDAAANADVVFIGEMHGHPLGLAAAAALWEDLLARTGSAGVNPALSLEFIDRDHQAALDDYLLGVIDDKTFRDIARRSEGNYPEGHARMVDAAKAADARVYAANAPRRYTTLARTDGYESLRSLRASQRRLYDIPESLDDGPYRDSFFELFAGMMASHAGDTDPETQQTQIEGFFRAQQLWDATMADTISRALSDANAPVVHVVGQFHTDNAGGTYLALRDRRPDARILTISMVEAESPDDESRADYIIVVGPANNDH